MKFQDIIRESRFSLIASLPSNDLKLARAALEGGAHAIKVHCNVWHRASGHTFGSYEENRLFLRELIRFCGDVPVGLVPGAGEAFIKEADLKELEQMGLAFLSAYSHHLPCFAMDSEKLACAVAIDSGYTETMLDAIRDSDIPVLECSIIPGTDYGTDLTCGDVIRYGSIVRRTGKPCIVPTQKRIRPEDIPYLHRAGCKALMIGAVVFGQNPEPEKVRAVTAAYRAAIDAL